MDLKDFLEKVRDRSLSENLLSRYYREMMYRNLKYDNLDDSEKNLLLEIILKYRRKLLKGEKQSLVDLERDYYRIWEKRHALGLEYNDLKMIKELIYSFKS